MLPGEQEVDEVLLDQVVERINRTWAVKGLETAREIGEFVLATFFEGDPDVFRRRERKHESFRALARRSDLHVSHMWIWRAVSVVDQLRLLPEDIADSLPYTHHTLLLPIKSDKTKKRLAQRAAENNWTKRKLESEVRKVRARETRGSKVGRPPLPRFQKSIHKLRRMLKDPDETFGDLEAMERLESKDVQRLHQTVLAMKHQCEALQEALEKRLPEPQDD